MAKDYFQLLKKKTKSRMWINNPSLQEARMAQEQGAFACTTNPAYCAKLLKSDKAGLDAVIDSLVDEWHAAGNGPFDYEVMALQVYQRVSKQLMDLFLPEYNATNGKSGFVTMQDNPNYDEDTEHTVRNVLINRELAPNFMAKIPVIQGGIEAIETCVEHNIPICATEVFAVSQALDVAACYEAACKKFGNRPQIFLTHISGIFDEYLGKYAQREGIDVSPEALKLAGVSVARKQFRLLKEHGYDITMLGGGARGLHHFTGIVGGPHITINWSTAAELLDGDYAVEEVIEREPDASAVEELLKKLPAFQQAYEVGCLTRAEYASFGPVQLFRNSFLNGWYSLMAEIAARRNARAL
jgi:transaldolase